MSTRSITRLTTAPLRAVPAPAEPAAAPARRQLVELWHPWVSRHWPCTAAEETVFVADLAELAGDPVTADDEFDRPDVTTIVTALRCGLTVAELLDKARGLRPRRLAAAHAYLDRGRREAEQAWGSIVADPTSGSLRHHGRVAATLLPVIISHLDSIERSSRRDLESSVRAADSEIVHTTQSVVMLEQRLEQCVAPSEHGRAIGGLLYDAYGDGAWALGTFLAPRVGTLVPLRVASLLGEELPGQLRQAS